jgi:hypothetical protein
MARGQVSIPNQLSRCRSLVYTRLATRFGAYHSGLTFNGRPMPDYQGDNDSCAWHMHIVGMVERRQCTSEHHGQRYIP